MWGRGEGIIFIKFINNSWENWLLILRCYCMSKVHIVIRYFDNLDLFEDGFVGGWLQINWLVVFVVIFASCGQIYRSATHACTVIRTTGPLIIYVFFVNDFSSWIKHTKLCQIGMILYIYIRINYVLGCIKWSASVLFAPYLCQRTPLMTCDCRVLHWFVWYKTSSV